MYEAEEWDAQGDEAAVSDGKKLSNLRDDEDLTSTFALSANGAAGSSNGNNHQ